MTPLPRRPANAVDINYFYGGQFYGDANITSRMEGWYTSGTEVVFACGGGIYTSALEAAIKSNGYIIGVDVDQNYIGANGVADGTYEYKPVHHLRYEGADHRR